MFRQSKTRDARRVDYFNIVGVESDNLLFDAILMKLHLEER